MRQGLRTDIVADPATMYSAEEAQRATGFSKQTVSRWREHVRRAGQGRNISDREIIYSAEEAERATGFSTVTVSRWRKELKDKKRYHGKVRLAAYRKAGLEADENIAPQAPERTNGASLIFCDQVEHAAYGRGRQDSGAVQILGQPADRLTERRRGDADCRATESATAASANSAAISVPDLPAVINTSRGPPAWSKPMVTVTSVLPTKISSVMDLRRLGSRVRSIISGYSTAYS